MCGAVACAHRNAARRSTCIDASQSADVNDSNGLCLYTDAMLIRISIRPNAAIVDRTTASQAIGCVRSAWKISARRFAART